MTPISPSTQLPLLLRIQRPHPSRWWVNTQQPGVYTIRLGCGRIRKVQIRRSSSWPLAKLLRLYTDPYYVWLLTYPCRYPPVTPSPPHPKVLGSWRSSFPTQENIFSFTQKALKNSDPNPEACVADPDTQDPYVFGPPGSGSWSSNQ